MDIQKIKKYLNDVLQEPQDLFVMDHYATARKELARTILGMLDYSDCEYLEKTRSRRVDNWNRRWNQ